MLSRYPHEGEVAGADPLWQPGLLQSDPVDVHGAVATFNRLLGQADDPFDEVGIVRPAPQLFRPVEHDHVTPVHVLELALDVKDIAAAARVIDIARLAGAEDRLWLCHPELEVVASWRGLSDGVKLVDSTRLKRLTEGPERRAARQRSLGVDAVNLHASDWSGGLIALFHRFERYSLGWDAQLPRVLDELLDAGIDGVFSDYVERMSDALIRSETGQARNRPPT